MKQLKAIILAGGVGKRMWPVSLDKSLIPFLDKPVIEFVIDDLLSASVKDFLIIANPQNQASINELINKKKINGQTVIQEHALGMANALLQAENYIGQASVIIVNSDDLFAPNILKDLIHQVSKQEIVLTGMEVDKYLEAGYFKLMNDLVTGLVEKPGAGNEPSKFCKLVADYFYEPKFLFEDIKESESTKDDLYEVALDKILRAKKVNIFKVKSNSFQQIKFPWHILKMMTKVFTHRFSTGVAKKAKISNKAIIEGKVVMADGVQVMAGAIVKGPVFIGENTVVGNNALVRESMIGKNCVVGFSSEVARSWVGNNTWFHSNYIGDSVIEDGCNFGSGARTANLRFDGKEVVVKKGNKQYFTGLNKLGAIVGKDTKVGINASLMPGILVGKNSFVGAGMVLNQNIEDNKVCYKKTNLVIKNKIIK